MSTTPDERLKPCLLDRLTDNAPNETRESLRERFATAQSLRESVVRDLGWLLNCVRLSSVQDLAAYPYAARSVINFGLSELAGRTLSSIDLPELETEIRQAILDFEPRFVPESVRVSVQDRSNDAVVNSLQLTIEAMLQAYPAPLGLWLRTEIDFETGDVNITDLARPPDAAGAGLS